MNTSAASIATIRETESLQTGEWFTDVPTNVETRLKVERITKDGLVIAGTLVHYPETRILFR